MPRINTVKKARKDQGTCRGCGREIKAGDGYKWIKFRYGGKVKKCSSCNFRSSELTSSDKLSRLYAAQEDAHDRLDGWDREDADEIRSLLEDTAQEIREVGEEYQESADAIREHFETSDTADECEEKAQEIEGWADEVEGADVPEWDDEEIRDEILDGVRSDMIGDGEAVDCPTCQDAPSSECQTCHGLGIVKGPDFDGDNFQESVEEKVQEGTSEKRSEWADEVVSVVESVIDECPV